MQKKRKEKYTKRICKSMNSNGTVIINIFSWIFVTASQLVLFVVSGFWLFHSLFTIYDDFDTNTAMMILKKFNYVSSGSTSDSAKFQGRQRHILPSNRTRFEMHELIQYFCSLFCVVKLFVYLSSRFELLFEQFRSLLIAMSRRTKINEKKSNYFHSQWNHWFYQLWCHFCVPFLCFFFFNFNCLPSWFD